MANENFIIKDLTIVRENGIEEHGYIKVENGKISEVGPAYNLTTNEQDKVYRFSADHVLIPGMIDVHIHGANGADTMDATYQALDTITETLPKEGTTSFLVTTITQSTEKIEKALINVANYLQNGTKEGHAEILGVHLEGPFISKEKAGAQPLDYIIEPDVELFNKFQRLSNHQIKLVTLAPEVDPDFALIKHLRKDGVVASIGHSNATYDEIDQAIEAGTTHVTHLYNGMSGLHHREPGVVGGALLRDELYAELIVDGIHSRPEMIKLAFQQKGKDRLILITDAMRAKCLRNGVYDLGGQEVTVKDGKAELKNGHLAGSVLKMADGFKNMLTFTDANLQSLVDMVATNPAKQLNVFDRKGSIAIGKDADLVILDEHYQVVMTFCKGVLSYEKEALNNEDY